MCASVELDGVASWHLDRGLGKRERFDSFSNQDYPGASKNDGPDIRAVFGRLIYTAPAGHAIASFQTPKHKSANCQMAGCINVTLKT
jgi:hypothetical protein